jgi:hypothetical protein
VREIDQLHFTRAARVSGLEPRLDCNCDGAAARGRAQLGMLARKILDDRTGGVERLSGVYFSSIRFTAT